MQGAGQRLTCWGDGIGHEADIVVWHHACAAPFAGAVQHDQQRLQAGIAVGPQDHRRNVRLLDALNVCHTLTCPSAPLQAHNSFQ